MKRVIVPIVMVAALAFLGALLAINPGQASAQWLGWRVDTSASLVAVLGIVLSLLLAALWSFGAWLVQTPRRLRQSHAETSRRRARAVLTQGHLALASGETAEAAKFARAATALDDGPLPHLLAAQAAEAAGDDAAAQGAYAALLVLPEAQAAARRGLARLSLKRGEPVDEPPSPPLIDDTPTLDR